ncbi:MAG: lytic transglycosylase domain-containing protein [Burkholderia sp.]|uniref:lytic transglycosylase domain-containing protein n=2 Tax=Burkholderiaceae TaxID=119060 RepID=UPI0015888BCF|nr:MULTISPECIES: lytic transglycosylase domain-containing protein [Burkholderia]MBY8606294.1 lytic transglycosylase domain-containing protein [Burkholderia arboris]MCA3783296.1 lytic transglycosylase domain-containing protein [Burkholderia sp.]MCA3787794.1 lytic transglycosylase domain-containing protein [Burkholderia sp.]MCA3796204.1 lytic transglycosylase domain-containing protein [Burkholderia sp.]MCA3801617.1 lytic transglycosylase domain-containing protein [Burkholderia sp.]
MAIRAIALLALLPSLTPVAHAECFAEAAAYQHVNETILRALAWQESHDNVNAKRVNTNGSIDYGLMQINSIHLTTLSTYGITSHTLMDPCASVYIAAWHLRKMMLKYGNTWKAVGAYHSQTPAERDRYAAQVRVIVQRMQSN